MLINMPACHMLTGDGMVQCRQATVLTVKVRDVVAVSKTAIFLHHLAAATASDDFVSGTAEQVATSRVNRSMALVDESPARNR